ncbi:MAG: M20 family metallo-hydrolase [Tepidanaerobacter acetatoxydans]|uniref:amidohydrolase n=1 Tax=Tepidanaerobacter acetatoxydans TaxID=499229 RepID=UPI0026EB4F9B|nr:amidohydrolase [Tepidanaerobacter acetatoxydans]NLU10253.1 M20 family metallo-hydrolase [Tepidanaerobacter acetatoxydans]
MDDIKALAKSMESKAIAYRRDFHKYPEVGWTEFRTSSKVAEILMALGYEVKLGRKILKEEAIMGLPTQQEMLNEIERAVKEGANSKIIEMMENRPGVVGILHTDKPGPTVAFRFDMDALSITEAQDDEHRPYKENFSSIHDGIMHACGHDGHVAVGLCLAEMLIKIKDKLSGTVKLIFQPSEEGVRGARAMVEAGVVDDVDYFLAFHIGFGGDVPIGLAAKTTGFLATSKTDVTYTGQTAHAGAFPQQGKNALLGAASAVLNLHAIAPHSDGITRINVGVLTAGTSANIIPGSAHMKIETRGETTALNDYMQERAKSILEACAKMYGLGCHITDAGAAPSAEGDEELAQIVKQIGENLGLSRIENESHFGASDDATYFMEKVQSQGGKALYFQVKTPIASNHHNSRFDFDESCLVIALQICTYLALELL